MTPEERLLFQEPNLASHHSPETCIRALQKETVHVCATLATPWTT
jgi:hypothetical protein